MATKKATKTETVEKKSCKRAPCGSGAKTAKKKTAKKTA